MPCPDPTALESFATGRLRTEERAALEAHLDGCPSCAQTIAELLRLYGSEAPGWHETLAPSVGALDAEGLADGGDGSATGPSLGRYRLGRRLGAGGMGIVFEAHDPELHRRVAIKLLHPVAGEAASQVQERLLREARAMARLAHPHVVAVYDVGRLEDQIFVAMELIDGETLTAWLAARPRSRREIVEVFIQAGRGLEAAHREGLVHRDFKPDNVLIGRDGRARVTDFGLARPALAADFESTGFSREGTTALQTATGTLLGTPAYMAPEQWRGLAADARSDQFAFCVSLYRALFGQAPFEGNLETLADQVVQGRSRPVPKGTPRWLRQAVTRGLASDPAERHPSMSALLDELSRDRAWPRRLAAMALTTAIGAGAALAVFWWMADSTSPAGDEAPVASTSPSSAPEGCDAPSPADMRWSAPRREGIEARLGEMFDAKHLAPAALTTLDVWIDRYRHAEEALCGEPPAQQRSGRACLRGRMARFDALVQRMSGLQSWMLARGLAAPHGLPSVAHCTDARWLEATPFRAVDPPPGWILLEADIAAVEASMLLGRLIEAQGQGHRLVEQARASGHGPLIAEAELAYGLTLASRYDSDGAVAMLEAAAESALSANHLEVQTDAAIALIVEKGAGQLRPAEAERWVRFAESQAHSFGDPLLAARVATAVGRQQHALGNFAAAKKKLEEALPPMRVHAPKRPELGDLLVALATCLADLGEGRAAVAAAEEARVIYALWLGPEDLRVAAADAARARAYLASGELVAAEEAAEAAAKKTPSGQSLRHDLDKGSYYDLLGDIRAVAGDRDGALEAYRVALVYRFKEHQRAEPLRRRGALLVKMGRTTEGLRDLALAVELLETQHGKDDPRLWPALRAQGRAMVEAGRLEAARAILERAFALIGGTLGYGVWWAEAHLDLGALEQRAGRVAAAREHYAKAYVPLSTALGQHHPRVTALTLTRADLAWSLGDRSHASKLYGIVERDLAATREPDDPDLRRASDRAAP